MFLLHSSLGFLSKTFPWRSLGFNYKPAPPQRGAALGSALQRGPKARLGGWLQIFDGMYVSSVLTAPPFYRCVCGGEWLLHPSFRPVASPGWMDPPGSTPTGSQGGPTPPQLSTTVWKCSVGPSDTRTLLLFCCFSWINVFLVSFSANGKFNDKRCSEAQAFICSHPG